MQYRHGTVSGMLDNIKAIALNATYQKLRALSWSPSHSLTLQQRLDLCACLSSPLEWMMHPCAHVSMFVSHLFLQYGLDSGQKGQTVCRGEVSGNDEAPLLRGSQALAKMEAVVIATAEV